jgi:hypothetical protein
LRRLEEISVLFLGKYFNPNLFVTEVPLWHFYLISVFSILPIKTIELKVFDTI